MKSGPLLLCGVLAGPVFVTLFAIIGAFRADCNRASPLALHLRRRFT
jgi:hypothetical protein